MTPLSVLSPNACFLLLMEILPISSPVTPALQLCVLLLPAGGRTLPAAPPSWGCLQPLGSFKENNIIVLAGGTGWCGKAKQNSGSNTSGDKSRKPRHGTAISTEAVLAVLTQRWAERAAGCGSPQLSSRRLGPGGARSVPCPCVLQCPVPQDLTPPECAAAWGASPGVGLAATSWPLSALGNSKRTPAPLLLLSGAQLAGREEQKVGWNLSRPHCTLCPAPQTPVPDVGTGTEDRSWWLSCADPEHPRHRSWPCCKGAGGLWKRSWPPAPPLQPAQPC